MKGKDWRKNMNDYRIDLIWCQILTISNPLISQFWRKRNRSRSWELLKRIWNSHSRKWTRELWKIVKRWMLKKWLRSKNWWFKLSSWEEGWNHRSMQLISIKNKRFKIKRIWKKARRSMRNWRKLLSHLKLKLNTWISILFWKVTLKNRK